MCYLLFFTLSYIDLTVRSLGFPGGASGKEPNAEDIRDASLIPGSGRSPGGGHGNTLQYSCLEKFHGQRSLEGCSPYGYRVRHDRSDSAPDL